MVSEATVARVKLLIIEWNNCLAPWQEIEFDPDSSKGPPSDTPTPTPLPSKEVKNKGENELGMVASACDPNPWEGEARSQPWLPSKFKANPDFISH